MHALFVRMGTSMDNAHGCVYAGAYGVGSLEKMYVRVFQMGLHGCRFHGHGKCRVKLDSDAGANISWSRARRSAPLRFLICHDISALAHMFGSVCVQ